MPYDWTQSATGAGSGAVMGSAAGPIGTAVGAGIGALTPLLAYALTKPKKPKPMASQYMQQLQNYGLQTANQATSNAGLILGPAAAQRGMSGSGPVLSALSNVAGQASREAVGGAQKGYLTALLEDQNRQDAWQNNNAQNLNSAINATAESVATNVAGYGALQEQARQEALIEQRLRAIYGPDYDAFFGGSRPAGAQ